MSKQTKKMTAALALVDRTKTYGLDEAVAILAKFPKAKFDETVELAVNLGVDLKAANQSIRGIVDLPNGSGKKVRVIVFTENAQEALAAGADAAGMNELINKVLEGWTDFDVAISTTPAMKEVRKVARVLGPRGLMPNPKSGTVTDDVATAVKQIKLGGRIEFKMDKTGNVGVIVGKRSFAADKLAENIKVVIDALGKARPEGLKGVKFIKNIAISGSQTPSVRLDAALYSQY